MVSLQNQNGPASEKIGSLQKFLTKFPLYYGVRGGLLDDVHKVFQDIELSMDEFKIAEKWTLKTVR